MKINSKINPFNIAEVKYFEVQEFICSLIQFLTVLYNHTYSSMFKYNKKYKIHLVKNDY